MKILLVEDDVKLGKATSELLAYEGCTVDWAQDGAEAAAMVKEGRGAVPLLPPGPGAAGLDAARNQRGRNLPLAAK